MKKQRIGAQRASDDSSPFVFNFEVPVGSVSFAGLSLIWGGFSGVVGSPSDYTAFQVIESWLTLVKV